MPIVEAHRRDWRPQLKVLALVALIGTVPFWLTDLDLRVAARFYHPGADDPWFEAQAPLWSFLYVAAPLLTGLVMLVGLFVLAAGRVWRGFRRLRLYALFVIAITIIGPGLIVNGVFKDHWGRPRPHQVQEFGGTHAYIPPLAVGEPGKGKSFPSGHSSIGFMFAVFFMIWWRRRPLLAWAALAGSIALGTLLGLGRMAAGDHFLSDVIWSGVFVYATALILYYGVLRIPQREAVAASTPEPPLRPVRRPRLTAATYGLVAVLMVVVALLATPLKKVQIERVSPGEFEPTPSQLRVVADTLDVALFWIGGADRTAQLRLESRGFGLPWSHVDTALDVNGEVLTYRVTHRGLFTEKDTKLALGVVAGEWRRIEIRTASGDIQVYPSDGPLPELDLRTDDGALIEVEPS